MNSATAVFRARGVSVSFGGVRAVDGVDLDVGRGEVTGLIGPNGSGKTTFIDAVTGFVKYAGSVELDGTKLDGMPAGTRARRGLARTWQTVELFDDLNVRENLAVAGTSPGDADEVLSLLSLEDAADAMPSELNRAERKRAGIGRALAERPKLLLLDDPGAGLDSSQSAELARLLPGLAADGTAILLVDHDMGLVLGCCDRVAVLDAGKVLAVGTPAQVRADQSVAAAYRPISPETAEPSRVLRWSS